MTLDERVYKYKDQLNESDRLVWSYIANHKDECKELSIESLAARCLVSRTTILRFAKKIGLEGYQDLKFQIKKEEKKRYALNEKEIRQICEKYMYTIRLQEGNAMEDICYMLYEAERVFAYGSGFFITSGIEILKEEMFKANLIVHILTGEGEMRTYMENAREGDVVFFFSISGENKTTIQYAQNVRDKGVRTIAITGDSEASLCRAADAALDFDPLTRLAGQNDTSFFPITSLVFMLELLFYRYCLYRFNRMSEGG